MEDIVPIDLKAYKLALEESILVSFLDQNNMNELDMMEYNDFKIPYEHFNSNTTTKLVSKAIFNLQGLNEAITEENVFYYISKFRNLENEDYIRLISKLGFSFETMKLQLKKLIEINEEIKVNERLQEL